MEVPVLLILEEQVRHPHHVCVGQGEVLDASCGPQRHMSLDNIDHLSLMKMIRLISMKKMIRSEIRIQ
jgi:hypothetical protein